jgi:hypothetical protein
MFRFALGGLTIGGEATADAHLGTPDEPVVLLLRAPGA